MEQHDPGITHRIAGFVNHFAGDNRFWLQAKQQVRHRQARTYRNAGEIGTVLLVTLGYEAVMLRPQNVFAGSKAVESEASIATGQGHFSKTRIVVGGNTHLDPAERVPIGSADNHACDLPVRRWLRRIAGGPLRRERRAYCQKKCR
jgi:hypothetical protein